MNNSRSHAELKDLRNIDFQRVQCQLAYTHETTWQHCMYEINHSNQLKTECLDNDMLELRTVKRNVKGALSKPICCIKWFFWISAKSLLCVFFLALKYEGKIAASDKIKEIRHSVTLTLKVILAWVAGVWVYIQAMRERKRFLVTSL